MLHQLNTIILTEDFVFLLACFYFLYFLFLVFNFLLRFSVPSAPALSTITCLRSLQVFPLLLSSAPVPNVAQFSIFSQALCILHSMYTFLTYFLMQLQYIAGHSQGNMFHHYINIYTKTQKMNCTLHLSTCLFINV